MEDLFVPYEIAKSLKHAKYNERCIALYLRGDNLYASLTGDRGIGKSGFGSAYNSLMKENIAAPMYCQVTRWLRVEHKIFITASLLDAWDNWIFSITREDLMCPFYTLKWNGVEYKSEKEAIDQALIEALKLI